MKSTPGTVRVLVASDNVDNAKQIVHQLSKDFEHVRASTNPNWTLQDFEEYKPAILVLAFDTLEKAQGYYLGLHRASQSLNQEPHRTVVLCSKGEVHESFELCKKEYFDDYVLYWPHPFDGHRLAMSVWNACREIIATRAKVFKPKELASHAKHLVELETTLGHEIANGEQHIAAARSTLIQVEEQITGAVDDFSRRLADGTSQGSPETHTANRLAQEIDQLKSRQITQVRRASSTVVEPIGAWARTLKDQVEPSLAGMRKLTDKISTLRFLVMVVEDDEFACKVVSRTLDPKTYEVLFVGDGLAALSQLRRVRPDVILMDITLPGMNGVSLTQKLKASPDLAKIPVIIMTGDARRETLVSSMDVGAVAFVVKPFTRESLLSKLEKVLAH